MTDFTEPIIIPSSPLLVEDDTSDTEVNSDDSDTNSTFLASGEGMLDAKGIFPSKDFNESDSDDLPEWQSSEVCKSNLIEEHQPPDILRRETILSSGEKNTPGSTNPLTKIKEHSFSDVIDLNSDSDESNCVDELPLNERMKLLLPKKVSNSVKELIGPPRKRFATHDVSDEEEKFPLAQKKEKFHLPSREDSQVSFSYDCSSAATAIVSTHLTKLGYSDSQQVDVGARKTKSEIREQKKLEKEREKLLKNVEKEAKKINKPGESIKFMKINVDKELSEDVTTNKILSVLETNNLRYNVMPLAVKGCITWAREITQNVSSDLQLQENKQEVPEDEAVILLKFPEFLQMVYSFKQEKQGTISSGNTLNEYTQMVQELLPEFNLTYVVQETEKYFRKKKNCKNREYKAAVRGEQAHKKSKQDFEISRIDVEEAMLDVQLRTKLNFKFVENIDEVGQLLNMYTKAIADAPYKREQHKQLGLSWYAQADGASTVKVQKDGMVKLWQHQIMQFHQVSKDTAVAIVTHYPSPQALLQVMKKSHIG